MGEVFFVQKFIDGLRYNISSAIVLHKPRTVDAALSLALMQEELLETSSRRYQPRSGREFNRFPPRSGSTNSADAAAPPPDTKQLPKFTGKDKGEDKIASLRDQRRAQGLCMKCGEKWNRTHRCPKHIPIHILEEVLEAISVDDSQDEAQEAASTSSEEEVLSLSVSAVEGVQGKKTMRLQGLVNNQEVLLLVDSGSSSTFISIHTAKKLQLVPQDTTAVMVTMANDNKVPNNKIIHDLSWWSQGHTFTISARVPESQHYDIILGMDWLEQFSPMWVHWRKKKMRFGLKGKRIQLSGIKPCTSVCPPIKAKKLQGLLRKGSVHQLVYLSAVQEDTGEDDIPLEMQQIVQAHDDLFQPPTDLPPQRSSDHKITLLPGVQPVNVKPYRYNPPQKDEIE
jgi:predicted aspartyl protease